MSRECTCESVGDWIASPPDTISDFPQIHFQNREGTITDFKTVVIEKKQ